MDLRTKLLNSRSNRHRLVTVKVSDEETLQVKVKVPSLAELTDAQSQSDDHANMLATMVIYCAVDPETNKPIFEAADRDTLKTMDADSWVATIANSAAEMIAEAKENAKK